MLNLENLKKQAKQLVRWHREGNHSLAAKLRAYQPLLQELSELSDVEILARPFTLSLAKEVVAQEYGFESWQALSKGIHTMSDNQSSQSQTEVNEVNNPTIEILAVNPQLFVSDIRTACEYYTRTLGFALVFTHGEPPFYAEIERDGITLNLRLVCEPVIDQALREKETLLSAYFKVSGVKNLFVEFKDSGADVFQSLKKQPWQAQDFIIRDPFGNLLCFSGPVTE